MDEKRFLEMLKSKAQRILAKSAGMEAPPPMPEMPGRDPAMSFAATIESAQPEAVIRWYRPVLQVTDDRFVRSDATPNGDPRFVDPDAAASKALLDTLEANRALLDPAIRSVGRIELANNIDFPWAGTGWVLDNDIDDDIIVTNAHVGRIFGMASGVGFKFRPGVPDFSRPQSAFIDFREETGSSKPREFPITEIIWISEKPGLDMALLRVARTAGSDRIDPPIRLAEKEIAAGSMLAVIGFPGSNNGYDPEPFRRLFGPVTGKKRFSPGLYEGVRSASVTYDCSTLPGSSGSVVLDVRTGEAVGLHYAGTAFDTNYAVPGKDLRATVHERPWQGERVRRPRVVLGDAAGAAPAGADGRGSGAGGGGARSDGATRNADGSVTLQVPLEITLRLGTSATATSIGGAGGRPSDNRLHGDGAAGRKPDRAAAEAAVARVREHLSEDRDVVGVRVGCMFRDGRATREPAVAVTVLPEASREPAHYGLGESVDGVPISIYGAAIEEVAAHQFGVELEAFKGRRANYERDQDDPRFDLSPVTEPMKLTLHVSPEAGWPVLREFFAEDRYEQLTIGMYHMTAPHVVKAIEEIARRPKSRIVLSLDRQKSTGKTPDDITPGKGTKGKDIVEKKTLAALKKIAGDDRFRWAKASVGAQGLFASSYHIKVAVWSDRKAGNKLEDKMFWLSSGNWQSSNQCPLEQGVDEIAKVQWHEVKDYNREWHAVVENKKLAATFRHHLEQDYKDNLKAAEQLGPRTAELPDVLVPESLLEAVRKPKKFRAFPPFVITENEKVTVQPLLTPDNYPEEVLRLIKKAKSRIWLENQSFNLWTPTEKTPKHLLDLVQALLAQQEDGLDVRIIFRSGYGKTQARVDAMVGLGFDPERIRFFDHCHTKGIVIDDDKVVLGSQNWSGEGVGPNRDASLLIHHRGANAYFAEVFDYDWENVATDQIGGPGGASEAVRFIPADAEAPVPAGYRRVSLAEFIEET